MATLYVTEFASIAVDTTGISQAPQQGPLAEQTVAITGGSTASSAFNGRTRLIRLHCDTICSIEFGTAPVATTSTARMAANQTEYFTVPPGLNFKVAVVANV